MTSRDAERCLKRLTLSTILKASEHAVNLQVFVAVSENMEFLFRKKNDLACPHLVFINHVLTFLDLLRYIYMFVADYD